MSVSRAVMVTLRPAVHEDCERVWRWRNDEETRRASFDSSPVPFETHERWFLDSLRRRRRKVYIVVAGDRPSGVVRLDVTGRQATVSIHLAPEWRGRGVGPRALAALADVAFGRLGLVRLVARIKADNAASLAAFRRAGFTSAEAGADAPVGAVTLAMTRHAR